MPVTLLNNYPESNLHQQITTKDGITLYGELWLNIYKFDIED